MNTRSQLLGLPQEIQDKIWTDALGGFNIHVFNHAITKIPKYPGITKSGLFYVLCRGRQTPSGPFSLSYPTSSMQSPATVRIKTWPDEELGVCALFGGCDKACPLGKTTSQKPQPPSPDDDKLPVQLLRTCKKIYGDALPLLYGKANCFYFEDFDFGNNIPSVLGSFLTSLPASPHHGLLRNLHVRIQTYSPIDRPCNIEFSTGLGSLPWLTGAASAKIGVLSNLCVLSLNVIRLFDDQPEPMRNLRPRVKEGYPRIVQPEFGYLSALKLKELHVSVWNETAEQTPGLIVPNRSFLCNGRTYTRGNDEDFERKLHAYLLGLKEDGGAAKESLLAADVVAEVS